MCVSHQTFYKSLLIVFFSDFHETGTHDRCANTQKLCNRFSILLFQFFGEFLGERYYVTFTLMTYLAFRRQLKTLLFKASFECWICH